MGSWRARGYPMGTRKSNMARSNLDSLLHSGKNQINDDCPMIVNHYVAWISVVMNQPNRIKMLDPTLDARENTTIVLCHLPRASQFFFHEVAWVDLFH